MTIISFNNIDVSINHRLYPPLETPAGTGHHVPVLAGEYLLDSGNVGALFGMGASIGVCLKV